MQIVLKRKKMQNYFVTFLQGFPLKIWIFPKYFSLRTKDFFFHKKNLSAAFDMRIEKLDFFPPKVDYIQYIFYQNIDF